MTAADDLFRWPSNPDQKIWRYLDFTKFVSLLDRRALFFSSVDQMEDHLEGSIPIAEFKNSESESPSAHKWEIRDEEASRQRKRLRQLTLVSSWHCNDYESAAMWKLFLRAEGVVLQSTCRRLAQSLKPPRGLTIHLGQVHYMDYRTEKFKSASHLAPFIHKDQSFSHERELRGVIDLYGDAVVDKRFRLSKDIAKGLERESGMHIPADLDLLLEDIVLSPKSPEWFHDLIVTILKKFDCNKRPRRSSLDCEAFF